MHLLTLLLLPLTLLANIPNQTFLVGYVNQEVYQKNISRIPFLTDEQKGDIEKRYPDWVDGFSESDWRGWIVSYEHLTFSLLGFTLYGGMDLASWKKLGREPLLQISTYLLLRFYLLPLSPWLKVFAEGSLRAPTLLTEKLLTTQGHFAYQDLWGIGVILGGENSLHCSLRCLSIYQMKGKEKETKISIPCLLSFGIGF